MSNKNNVGKIAKVKNPPRAPKSAVKTGDGVIFYVLYADSYVSDERILPRGVYQTSEVIERLENSSSNYVKKFEGEIPDAVLHEIAETLKVSKSDANGRYRPSEEILAEIVQVM